VRRVLSAIRRLGQASTRAVSREVGLPLPVVAAVNAELRRRDVLTNDRPSKLTRRGMDLLGDELAPVELTPVKRADGGSDGVGELAALIEPLDALVARMPGADLTLDQSHSTAETKVRRVELMLREGLLPARGLLLIGDDDLMSITVAMAGELLGRPLVERLAVVDVAAGLLDFIDDHLEVRATLLERDLREPLPDELRGAFDLALTDPPYTTEGARLFLSRAVEGLEPGPGRAVVFSFGPKGPEDALRVQESVTDLGLVVHDMRRDFNTYHGAGVINGRSHLQILTTTGRTGPVVDGEYAGPMYTADKRAADRRYLCLTCGKRLLVGPRAEWATIAALKEAGCPHCGGTRFRPLQLVSRTREG
jgi:predicted methyltransferase/DNA-directed RNA polymerase subunit RPC12/RpoP